MSQISSPRACPWCGGPVPVRSRGRPATWCSATCRHRAWEQRRAAASGRSAVEVVERVLEVPVRVEKVVEVRLAPRGAEWAAALRDLAAQLDAGRVYDRDLPSLTDALGAAIAAYNRRAERHGR